MLGAHCTTLMNTSSVWCTFGTAWTRPSLTVHAIDEWHGRLRACVRAKCGHFEQMLTFIKTLIIQQWDNKCFICDFVSISYDLHGSFM